MLTRELNEAADRQIAFSNKTLRQMLVGLEEGVEKERVPRTPSLRLDHFGEILEAWDTERLYPSSCNLRSVVLMEGGVRTGLAGLAQETRPANHV